MGDSDANAHQSAESGREGAPALKAWFDQLFIAGSGEWMTARDDARRCGYGFVRWVDGEPERIDPAEVLLPSED